MHTFVHLIISIKSSLSQTSILNSEFLQYSRVISIKILENMRFIDLCVLTNLMWWDRVRIYKRVSRKIAFNSLK